MFKSVIRRYRTLFNGSSLSLTLSSCITSSASTSSSLSPSLVIRPVLPPLSSHSFNSQWKRVLFESEKIVNYSASYFNLRCLLSNEISNVARQLKKLVGTKHPLLKTVKRLLITDNNASSIQTRGLIVLLMAKAVEIANSVDSNYLQLDHLTTCSNNLVQNQCSLAEMTEMIYSAHLIHRGVINLRGTSNDGNNSTNSQLHTGNKISILSGDYLLASIWKGLAELRNTKVVELMAKSISDFMEGQFLVEISSESTNLLTDKVLGIIEYWEKRNFRIHGSLLANSCQSAVVLAHCEPEIQEKAYHFGKNFALAWQIVNEMKPFLDPFDPSMTSSSLTTNQEFDHHDECTDQLFDLLSAPVLMHILSTRGNLSTIETEICSNKISQRQLHHLIRSGHGIELTREMKNFYAVNALNALKDLPVNDAVRALTKIVYTLMKL